LEIFDEEWLVASWRGLLRWRGGRMMAAAMAGDAREAVLARGWRLLRLHGFWEKDPVPRPGDLDVQFTIESLHAFLGDPAPADRGENSARAKEQAERLAAGEREREKLANSAARQREKAEALERQTEAERQEWGRERAELRRRLRAAEEAHASLTAGFEAEVQRRLAQYRRQTLGVTETVEGIARDLDASPTDDLLQAVDATVRRHRELNEAFGTVSRLRAELRALRQAQGELEDCLGESVRVLPEARTLAGTVRKRVEHLEQRLSEARAGGADGGAADDFLRYIRSAPPDADGLARLVELEKTLAGGWLEGVLGASLAGRVRQALCERRDRLATLEHERALAALPAAEPARPSAPPPAAGEVWDVAAGLRRLGQTRPALIIDGYNLIRRAPELDEMTDGDGLAAPRELLVQWCRAKAGAFDRIEVVFDGVGAVSQRERVDNLTVTFARRAAESQNADDYIVGRVTEWQAAGLVVWVVTEDYGLRQRVATLAAGFVGSADMVRHLRGG